VNKRVLINLFLSIAISALAVFLLVTGKNNKPEFITLAPNITAASIDQILIQRNGKEDLLFQRSADTWQMESPVHQAADLKRIHAMLGLLQSRSYSTLDTAGLDLAPLLLDDPAVTLQLDEHEFHFGDSNPLEQHRYVLFGQTIHLIADDLYFQLTQPVEFYISREEE